MACSGAASFEMADMMDGPITRKQLKWYRREWKRNPIQRENPTWDDLAVMFGLEPFAGSSGCAVDPGTRRG